LEWCRGLKLENSSLEYSCTKVEAEVELFRTAEVELVWARGSAAGGFRLSFIRTDRPMTSSRAETVLPGS
jgi:hypothetical protein